MPSASILGSIWQRPHWALLLLCSLLAGCLHAPVKAPARDAAPGTAPTAPQTDEILALQHKNEVLSKDLAASRQKVDTLEQELAAMKMQVLEQEAVAAVMRLRTDSQQKRLDAAIIDVVRAKAKLRSLESRADAASTMAEAEIALKAVKKQTAPDVAATIDEIAAADQLLALSSKEFKAQNYGGALYLANQTKGAVRSAQMRLAGEARQPQIEGETSFVEPVPLKVLKANSNLRKGPGLDREVTGQLDKNELLMGYAYKDRWIRVETQQGLTGWIFQTLVGAR